MPPGVHQAQAGRHSYGEAVGVILLDSQPVPFLPGDVANATTYPYPVRFRPVPGLTVNRAIGQDPGAETLVVEAARELERQGVRAITSNCGFLGFHQAAARRAVRVPVMLSSLLLIPFILSLLDPGRSLAVVSADAPRLGPSLLAAMGLEWSPRLVTVGLQDQPQFRRAILEEVGTLDQAAVQAEILTVCRRAHRAHPELGAVLLECACLPPYAAAVQAVTGLPVFDFVTMIDFVCSTVRRQPYHGFM